MKFCSVTLGCKVNQYESQAIESFLISRGHTQAAPGEGCDAYIINTCAVTAESVRKSRQAVRRAKKLEAGALIAVCGCFSQLEPSAAVPLGADLVGGSSSGPDFALEIEKLVETRRGNSRTRDLAQSAHPPSNPTQSPAQRVCVGEEERRSERAFGDSRTRDLAQSARPPSNPTQSPAQRVCVGEEERRSERAFGDSRTRDLAQSATTKTRALLKIQDGCDNFCAYCVIPFARGRARSLPVALAADQASQLGRQGFREIVVTGIEISSYGTDLADSPPLTRVVREIGAAAPNARLRLGSLDPGSVTGAFCRELSDIPNLCGHFHLSLQSGCDDTLRRMGRKYDTGAAREAILALRRMFPDCGITADLITGFPGETGAEFEQTLAFIKSAAFSDMHIFPFSPRPGTRAADMPEQVVKSVRRERAGVAAAAAAEMARDFRLSQIGKTVGVLFERERGGYWIGHSGNYMEVAVKNGGKRNSLRNVLITGIKDGLVLGEI